MSGDAGYLMCACIHEDPPDLRHPSVGMRLACEISRERFDEGTRHERRRDAAVKLVRRLVDGRQAPVDVTLVREPYRP